MVLFNLSQRDKGFHTFPQGICPKVIVIVQQELKQTYYNVAVQPVNHYATGTPSIYSGLCKPHPKVIIYLQQIFFYSLISRLGRHCQYEWTS